MSSGHVRDAQYQQAAAQFGAALARLAAVYEPDADQRRDLLQDIHLALWRSLEGFAGQCSLRTWVYRVAHNVGISRRLRRRGGPRSEQLLSLDAWDEGAMPAQLPAQDHDPVATLQDERAIARLRGLVRALRPPDDQVMLLYLEDVDAASIGEITGLSAGGVATRVHRIKSVL